MWRLIGIALFAAGICIAQYGIDANFDLPGDAPGFSLQQFSIVVFGLTLLLAAAVLRPEHLRKFSPLARRRLHWSALLVTLLTLLALEIALRVMGMPTYYPPDLPDLDYQVVSWLTCDEYGCRMNYEEVVTQCAGGDLSGRLCIVNRQGYPNLSDFAARAADDDRLRNVATGDSFTQGFTADRGQSYVE